MKSLRCFPKVFRVFCLLAAAAVCLSGCSQDTSGTSSQGSSGEISEESSHSSQSAGSGSQSSGQESNASESSIRNISIPAVNSLVRYTGTAEDFMSGDKYTQWSNQWQSAVEASSAIRTGQYSFYKTVLPKLLTTGENQVVSPFNVYMALCLLARTTSGQTQQQILDVLGVDSTESLSETVDTLWKANSADTPVFKELLGNSVWLTNTLSYSQDTLNSLSEEYHASITSGEMGSTEMNQQVREWMNEATNNLLKDKISSVKLEPETVAALISTIYYSAVWEEPFSEYNTYDGTFHASSGDQTVSMMPMTTTLKAYVGNGFTAVLVPLASSGNMIFFLPAEGTSPEQLLAQSDVMDLMTQGETYAELSDYEVGLVVPKFEVKADAELSDTLKSLGITDVFDPSAADFSPLTSADNLYLSKVNHAALVKVDENGVEGTAYTMMTVEATAVYEDQEHLDFVLDRPFLFSVTGSDGTVLFAGTVS